MELKRLVHILRRSWILVLAFTVLGIAGGALASLVTPVQYSSATRLFVGVQIAPGSTTGDLVQGNNFAVQKVLAYIDVATSPRVLDPVITELKLDTTAADLAQQVTAVVEPNSVVIELAALGTTPEEATTLARAVANSFSEVVVNQLETPADGSASPVKVEILQPAVAPELPALPQVPLNLALGAVIGLAAGLFVAVILGFSDHRIRTREDLERISGVPVLGSIPTHPDFDKNPLITLNELSSPRAETFRTLRTNLQFGDVQGQLRSVLVTSAVPGEGKSTTVANLAVVLGEGGASVVLVEADLRAPRLSEYLGLDAGQGLTDVLLGRVTLEESLQAWGPHRDLAVLTAGTIPANPSEMLGSTVMAEVLINLGKQFDYVLVDAPPVLPVTDAAVLSRLTDGTLLVAGARRVKENEVVAAIDALETAGTSLVGMVITMLPTRGPDAQRFGEFSTSPRKAAPVQGSRVTPPAIRSGDTRTERLAATTDSGTDSAWATVPGR